MSTKTTTCVDVQLDTTAVDVQDQHSLVASNAHSVCSTPNQEITAKKREYSIVGDAYYASTFSGPTPTWLSDLINARVDTSVQQGLTDYDLLVQDVRNAIDSIDVAKNTFVEEISFQHRVDGVVGSHLDTLNATYNDKFATIVNLDIVEANAEYARVTQANDLKAAYEDYTNSRITSVQQAYADADSAIADDITALDVRIDDQESGLSATADAVSGLQVYVGLDKSTANPNGTGMLSRIGILEKQNDGVVEYISNTYDVMLGVEDPNNNTSNDQLDVTKEPYASWIAEDLTNGNDHARAEHIGDVYIQLTDETNPKYIRSFKFVKTAVDTTSPYATDPEGYTWALVTDSDANAAYALASQANDLADGKRRVFVGAVTPLPPYDVGDLWLIDSEQVINNQPAKVGDIFRAIEAKNAEGSTYEENDWVVASSYITALNAESQALETWKDEVYGVFAADIAGQVDGKAESFYQEALPHAEGTNPSYAKWVGDLWKIPSTNKEYIYQLVDGIYQWKETDVPDSVYDTIDGKKAIFVGNTAPLGTELSPIQINDMWITGDTPPNGYDPQTIYVCASLDPVVWTIPVKYTDDSGLMLLSNGLADGTVAINLSAATVDGTKSITEYVTDQTDSQLVVYSGSDHAEVTTAKIDDLYIETIDVTSAGNTYQEVTIYLCTTGYISSSSTSCIWTAQSNADTSIADLADLADGKRTIFSNTSDQVPAGEKNDLWIPKTGADDATYVPGEVYQHDGNGWVLATKYTEDLNNFVDETYIPDSSQIHRQLDGKIEYYFYDSYTDIGGATDESEALATISAAWTTQEDRDEANGNIVYFKDSTKAYWYQASTPAWVAVTDTSIYQSLQKAAEAKGAADGKVSQFYAWGGANAPADYTIDVVGGGTETVSADTFLYWFKANKLYHNAGTIAAPNWVLVPTTIDSSVYIAEGDLVTVFDPVDGDTSSYSFNGTSWQSTGPSGIISKSRWFVDLDNAVYSPDGHLATSVSGVKVSGEAYTDAETRKVENKFSYDSIIYVDDEFYRTGFGLDTTGTASNGDGTVENPYDSEFWINAERLVLKSPTYPGVQAAFSISDTGIYLDLEHTAATRNEPKGAYSGTTTYHLGDMVTYNGSSYVALKTLVGITPAPNDVDWQLLASQGDSPVMYTWDGSQSWPTSTTIAGAIAHTFNSDFPGNATVRIEAYDAEGGVRVSLNGGPAQPMSRTGPDNSSEWYSFHFDNVVEGTNTLSFWSTTSDGGSITKIRVAFVGAGADALTVTTSKVGGTTTLNFSDGTSAIIDDGASSGVTLIFADNAAGSNASFTQGSRKYVNHYEWTGSAPTVIPSGLTYTLFVGQDGDSAGVIPIYANNAAGSGATFTFNDQEYVNFYEWTGSAPSSIPAGLTYVKFVGTDGGYTDFLFTRKSSVPTNPGSGDTWYTDVTSVPAGAGDLYSIKKVVGPTGSVSYSDKRVIQAPIVRELTIYSDVTTGAISSPSASTSKYNFSTDTLTINHASWNKSIPSITAKNQKIYVATAIVTGNETETSKGITWSTSTVYAHRVDGANGQDGSDGSDGSDGLSVYITYHFNSVSSQPSTPSGNGTTGGWTTTPSSNANWMSQKVASSASSGTWGSPILITGKDGIDGADGANGSNGARGVAVLTYSANLGSTTVSGAVSSIPTYWNSAASSEFDAEKAGDTLVVTNTSTTSGWTHIYKYNGSSWSANSVFKVNGDQIVDGTVVSDALVTDIVLGRDATFEGKVELVGSTHKRVSSANAFGTNNQFIEWFGPVGIAEGSMSEANAITYLKTDGSAYFGGAIISGALSTSSTTSSLGTAETVEIGPFGSNGGIIAINCSVTMNSNIYYGLYDGRTSIPAAPSAPSCNLTLEEYTGGSWVHRQSASYTGTGYNGTFRWDGEHGVYIGPSYQSLSGSFTFTDAKQTTANRTYRLRMTGRSGLATLGDWTPSQRVSINAQEQ